MEFMREFRPPLLMQSFHCSCHRLQLASIQAAASVKEIRMFLEPWPVFGSCFIISPKSRGSEGHPGCSWFSQAEDCEA